MKPVVTIVGRPNVGKSTLFNRIIGRNKAIAHETPGVTRDINYGDFNEGEVSFTLVDTGGFERPRGKMLTIKVIEQVQLAIEEAAVIVLLMDVRDGLMPTDTELADVLRKTSKPVISVVNKVDSDRYSAALSEFYKLGMDDILAISAVHGTGVAELIDRVCQSLPKDYDEDVDRARVKIAIVGRPNVGKSSLVNKLLGYERVIVSDTPGTTTDAIDTPFNYDDEGYLLIDTAGIRKKSRISRRLEQYCVLEAIKSVDKCDIALLVIDASEGAKTQDAKIASLIYSKAKGCILIINKWDLVTEKKTGTAEEYTARLRRRFSFLSYAPIIFVSAHTGQRVMKILDLIVLVCNQMQHKVSTSTINRFLKSCQEHRKPPSYKGRSVKIRYITQTGVWPPAFMAFSNYPEGIGTSYKRYLVSRIRETLNIKNSPVKISFKTSRSR
jgi:GTP-binding protein